MFSQTTEYALRVITHLAGLDGVPATTQQIAEATRVPVGYLAKVLQQLSRAGMIRSQRGLHGGSVLARKPEGLTILDVIESVDPLPRIRTCPLDIPSHGTKLCPLHRRLDDAMAQVERALRRTTIAELVAEPAGGLALGEATAPAARPAPRQTPVAVNVPSKDHRRRRRPARKRPR